MKEIRDCPEKDEIVISDSTRRRAELLFAAVVIARSTSFLLTKIGLDSFDVFTMLAIRFLVAFLFLAVVFHRRFLGIRGKTLWYGFLLGAMLFAVMTAELLGLKTVSASETSLIENMAIVFVPLFESVLLHRRPKLMSIVCAVTAFIGVAFLTMKNGGSFSLSVGEIYCILAALCYSSLLILTNRLAQKDDPFILGILQVGFLGILALIAAFLFEAPHLPTTGTDWAIILYLALVCTCFGFTLQPVAQRHMSSERAGLLTALNPAFAAILSMIFLKEMLGVMGFIGAGLILLAILLPFFLKKKVE